MAMVHSLPLEIIAEVFHFVLWKSDPYPATLHQLAQVCVRWRDLILFHPPFWAIIDEAFGERWAEWAVKRAKNVPLAFLYVSDSPGRPGKRDKSRRAETFVDCLMQNLHRCGVVVFAPRDQGANNTIIPNAMQQILHTPDLSLSSFVFYIRGCSGRQLRPLKRDYLRCVGHKTQQTRMMSVTLGMFSGGSPLARNLTRLRLFWWGPIDNEMEWDKFLSVEVLVDTLQACPTLESLELESIDVIGIPSSTLHLPNLKELALTSVSGDLAHALLPMVDAPCCQLLSMSLDPPDEPLGQMYDVLDAPILRTVCENMNKSSNTFHTFWAQVATDPDDQIGVSVVPHSLSNQLLIFMADIGDELRAFQQIISLLPDPVFSAPQLELSLLGHSPSLYSTFARRFPLVDSITVEVGVEDHWEGFLEFLTTHRLTGGEHLVWPALKSLIVFAAIGEEYTMTFHTEPLIGFLRARIDILHGESMGTGPRKFEKLHFTGRYEGLDGVNWADLVEDCGTLDQTAGVLDPVSENED
ncbi:hypothetical protein FRB99_002904 [Tulasnella sp. 403]|nr:hypothetical protein FRB99_002904 [Tulasnella sp. 403]